MGMSDVYGPADEAESIATIHAALDAGGGAELPGLHPAPAGHRPRRHLPAGPVDPAVPLAIGWVLSRGPGIVPLVGARRRDRLAEALGALPLELTADDLAAIERAVPAGAAAGDRNHAPQMATLDSERAVAAAR